MVFNKKGEMDPTIRTLVVTILKIIAGLAFIAFVGTLIWKGVAP
jgi:hypothetical protein